MHKFLLLYLSLLFSTPNYSQITLIDNGDHSPVSFAHLIAEDGRLLGTSDLNGQIKIDSINTIQNKHISIQHLSYENIEIALDKSAIPDTFFMVKRKYTLPDVTVHASNKEVLVIKAYYRSYELNNDIPKFFTDGFVEYYIPVSNDKKIKMKRMEFRSFRNEELLSKEKERTNTIVMRLAGIPRIVHNSVSNSIRENKKITLRETSGNETKIIKNDCIVGTIVSDTLNSVLRLSMDFIAPKKSEEKSLFRYTSRITTNEVSEIYTNMHLQAISLDDLIRRNNYRKIFFKHKKDADFVKLEAINELHVLQKHYITNEEFKAIESDSHALPESSSYSEKHWSKLSEYGIPEINENTAGLIGKVLTAY